MRFDLVDLRLFVDTVEAGTISAGAAAANMALASASERLSGMEGRLGAALLERGRRGVRPTAAGLTLLRHARLVLVQVEHMHGDLAAFANGLRADVRLLSNTAALVELVPATLRTFLSVHPNIDVDLEERTSAEIVPAIAEGRANLGIIAGSTDPGPLQTRQLAVDRLTLVAASTHPLAGRECVAFAEILDEPFVGLAAGALHDHLTHQAARLGRRMSHRVRLRGFDSVAALVEAGIGIAILPLAAAERHALPGLSRIPLSDAWAQRRLLACAIDFGGLTMPARRLLEALESQAQAVRT